MNKSEETIQIKLTSQEAGSIIFTDEKVAKKVTLEGKEYECFESQTILKLPEKVATKILGQLIRKLKVSVSMDSYLRLGKNYVATHLKTNINKT